MTVVASAGLSLGKGDFGVKITSHHVEVPRSVMDAFGSEPSHPRTLPDLFRMINERHDDLVKLFGGQESDLATATEALRNQLKDQMPEAISEGDERNLTAAIDDMNTLKFGDAAIESPASPEPDGPPLKIIF